MQDDDCARWLQVVWWFSGAHFSGFRARSLLSFLKSLGFSKEEIEELISDFPDQAKGALARGTPTSIDKEVVVAIIARRIANPKV